MTGSGGGGVEGGGEEESEDESREVMVMGGIKISLPSVIGLFQTAASALCTKSSRRKRGGGRSS